MQIPAVIKELWKQFLVFKLYIYLQQSNMLNDPNVTKCPLEALMLLKNATISVTVTLTVIAKIIT